jgi:hypothetical protein
MSYQLRSSRQLCFGFWTLYAVLSLAILAALVSAIERLFGKARYAPLGSLRYLVVWACILNALSAVLFLGFGRKWLTRFRLFASIDLVISAAPFLLIRLFRLPPELQAHYMAVTYVSFTFLKCATLVLYAYFNSITASYNAVRWWVFLSSLIVYLGFAAWISQSTWPTGDGVHYLLLTHSLVADHDIDLANNYRNGDYHAFYPPHADEHAIRNNRGQALPIHDLGLSVLLIPGYVLGGKAGALAELSVAAALSALGMVELVLLLGADVGSAILTWGLFGFSTPILVFASEVSPEIVGAALLLWAVTAFLAFTREERLHRLLLGGGLLALLPWISIRFWMFTGPLLALMSIHILSARSLRNRASRTAIARALSVLVLPAAISLVTAVIYDRLRYGLLLPNAGYVLDVRMQRGVFAFKPQVGFLGLMLDRAFGLLPIAPNYILCTVGARKFWKANRLSAAFIFFPVACYVVFLSFSQYWYGGWCPPARLLVTALCLCAPLAALSYSASWARRAAILLGAWTGLVTFIQMAFPNTRYVATPDVTKGRLGVFLQHNLGLDPVTHLFPSFIRAGFKDYLGAVVWAILLITIAYVASCRTTEERPWR